MKQDDWKTEEEYLILKELVGALIDKLNMVFISTMFLILLQHVVLTSGRGNHIPPYRSLALDKAALLQFRIAIVDDPNFVLSNWNESVGTCDFKGVLCDRRRHRVSQLILNESHLTGTLSPALSNLTGLRKLWIINSQLTGTIPHEFAFLRHLRSLRLDGNSLHGQIPVPLFHLPNLESILLLNNHLNGTLSSDFFSNCSSALTIVDLSQNSYHGDVPVEIGNCKNLWSLSLYNNQFTGEVPLSLKNTSLRNLDIEFNSFTGKLPSEIVGSLPELLYLHLSGNDMESHDGNTNLGPFFASVKNCTHLEELELAEMALGGRLPDSIGQLGDNLTSLLLDQNRITGSIPLTVWNISKLTVLNLSSNDLNGPISEEIRVLPQLEQLFLSHNFFSGPIPKALGRFRKLGLLDLSHNSFSGKIPESIGNLSRMNYLFLNNNLLSGKIPPSLGHCTELHKIDLSHNKLSGSITSMISGMSEIRIFINFSHNQLEGHLPDELSKLEDVQEIDLSSNNLSGPIMPQILSCIAVKLINFSNNSLDGNLPEIGELKNLEVFDVSRNRLSGPIPASLNKSTSLTYLNLSFNDFEGMVPSGGIFSRISYLSLMNNPRLCGNIVGIRACPRKMHFFRSRLFLIVFSTVIFVSAFFTVICCVIGFRRVKIMISNRKHEGAVRWKPRAPELILNFPRITFRELSEATAGFDEQRLVGSGSYGRVYKGVLSDGTAVAVKVLHVQSGNSTKSFTRECQVLKRIRHRNLIRIITACSLPDFKALVLPYMANGSLDSRLYPHSGSGLGSGSSDLNLLQRVNICSDIAEGMAYLHHHSPVKVIHCDLKPSNVLLNDDMTALVSDFGIARLVMTAAGGNAAAFENMGNSTANMLAGSIGYIAPEYGFGSITSTKGDVYSFGIIVLEMVTRKRPTDDMFVDGLSLHKWVKSHYHERTEKVVDSSLLRASKDQLPEVKKMWEVAIGELIELGILCTQESPSTRPTMLDAADDLDRLKRYLFGDTTATFASSLGISSSTLDDD